MGSLFRCVMTVVAAPLKMCFKNRLCWRERPRVCATRAYAHEAARQLLRLEREDQHQRGQQRQDRDRLEPGQEAGLEPGATPVAQEQGAAQAAEGQRHDDEDPDRVEAHLEGDREVARARHQKGHDRSEAQQHDEVVQRDLDPRVGRLSVREVRPHEDHGRAGRHRQGDHARDVLVDRGGIPRARDGQPTEPRTRRPHEHVPRSRAVEFTRPLDPRGPKGVQSVAPRRCVGPVRGAPGHRSGIRVGRSPILPSMPKKRVWERRDPEAQAEARKYAHPLPVATNRGRIGITKETRYTNAPIRNCLRASGSLIGKVSRWFKSKLASMFVSSLIVING